MPSFPLAPEPPVAPRRRFLQMLAGGGALAGAASLGVGCGGASTLSGLPIDGGNVSALSVGSIIALSSEPVALARDAAGVYAMTLVCTHQGCEVTGVTPQGLTCPCHGSTYDVNGAVTRGPAPTPLDHLAVTISATGEITVATGTVVPASTRTPVTG